MIDVPTVLASHHTSSRPRQEGLSSDKAREGRSHIRGESHTRQTVPSILTALPAAVELAHRDSILYIKMWLPECSAFLPRAAAFYFKVETVGSRRYISYTGTHILMNPRESQAKLRNKLQSFSFMWDSP